MLTQSKPGDAVLAVIGYGAFAEEVKAEANRLVPIPEGWYAEGKLKPHVSATFPLERASEALTLMANRQVKGKVVLVT
jgi:NADPH:quinone reductase